MFDEEQINLIKAFPGPLSRLVGLHLLRQLRREALGFLVLRFWLHFRSVFRFWCSLRFADFPNFSIWFSVFAKNIDGFSNIIFDAVFGFSEF